MKKLLLFFTLSVSFLANAQSITWQKNLGGSANDSGNDIKQTADGGYIVVGYTSSSANGDVSAPSKGLQDGWVIKLNATGGIVWEKNIGGAGNDTLASVQQTADGGYIIGGYTESSVSGDVTGTNNGTRDSWVVKLNAAGTIVWQKNYGGSDWDDINSIEQTADGGYIFIGSTLSSASGDVTGIKKGNYDIWVVKLNSSGNITWQKNLGGTQSDLGYIAKQTADGGYYIGGYTLSSASNDVTGVNNGAQDAWLLKLDSSGNTVWQKNYGGSGNESFYGIQLMSDGGCVLAGFTGSSVSGDVSGTSKGNNDVWVLRLSSTGSILWEKNYGGAGLDIAYNVQQTTDGGFIVGGYSTSTNSGDMTGVGKGSHDAWLLSLNSNGNLIWEKNFGGSGIDYSRNLQQTSNGGFIFTGPTASSSNGDVADASKGGYDFWVVKIDTSNLFTANSEIKTIDIYPNPTSAYFSVKGIQQKTKIEVVDMAGKVVLATSITNGSPINIERLSKGVYLIKINGQILKLIKQ